MTEHSVIYSSPMILARKEGRKSQTRRIVSLSNSTVLGYRSRALWSKIDLASSETWMDPGPDLMGGGSGYQYLHARCRNPDEDGEFYRVRPRWEVGDILWAREAYTVTAFKKLPKVLHSIYRLSGYYDADAVEFDLCLTVLESEKFARRQRKTGKVNSIFMYRSLCRFRDVITRLRVQRVQQITEADAWAEGCKRGEPTDNGGYFPAWELDDPSDPKSVASGWDCASDWYADLWDLLHGEGAWERNEWVWVTDFQPAPPPKKRLKRWLNRRKGGRR